MDDIIRITRVLVYEGPRREVEAQVARSLPNGTKTGWGRLSGDDSDVTITAQTIGNFPTVISFGEAQAQAFEYGRRSGVAEAQDVLFGHGAELLKEELRG